MLTIITGYHHIMIMHLQYDYHTINTIAHQYPSFRALATSHTIFLT